MSDPQPLDGPTIRASAGASGNRLLVALSVLSPDASAWLGPHLERVALAQGDVLAAPGEAFTHLYFPTSAVMSVICRMADKRAAEVGTVGKEGMLGVSAFLEAEPSPNETLAQIPGESLRVTVATLADAVTQFPALRRLLNRYTQEYITQISQTAACNRLHGIEQRCARWLLMTQDRADSGARFPLTQQYLAIMLGVRRASVAVAAGALQDSGLIRYRRGGIRVIDRDGAGVVRVLCGRPQRIRPYDRPERRGSSRALKLARRTRALVTAHRRVSRWRRR
jgi:CRP-like cAMP-binding protein